jgi:hypothetical protein
MTSKARYLCATLVALAAAAAGQTENQTLIAQGDEWRYFKGAVAPGASWTAVGFNDASWLAGPTGIGYGDNDDATVLGDMQNGYMAVFMRRAFALTSPQAVVALSLAVTYDDGFAAYLNGQEIARVNLAAGAAWNLGATASVEPTLVTQDLAAFTSALVAGTNVLAIEIHNNSIGSSDLSMLPVLSATLLVNRTPFRRGDANVDGVRNIADATAVLKYLFEDGAAFACPDAADVNDDGRLNLLDPVYLLANLFVGGPAVPEPRACGIDTTYANEQPALAACTYAQCP